MSCHWIRGVPYTVSADSAVGREHELSPNVEEKNIEVFQG